jgi:hypothetical protein
MNPAVLKEAHLYSMLLAIDTELAAATRKRGCRHCGAKLHDGGFERKPRGAPVCLPPGFSRRTSFDCSRCRARTLPPSVRFLERRVHLAAVLVLVSACERRAACWLARELGVAVRTVDRWRRFWRETFVVTPLWQNLRGQFLPPLEAHALPAALLERLQGVSPMQQLVRLLRLLVPLSPRTACA